MRGQSCTIRTIGRDVGRISVAGDKRPSADTLQRVPSPYPLRTRLRKDCLSSNMWSIGQSCRLRQHITAAHIVGSETIRAFWRCPAYADNNRTAVSRRFAAVWRPFGRPRGKHAVCVARRQVCPAALNSGASFAIRARLRPPEGGSWPPFPTFLPWQRNALRTIGL